MSLEKQLINALEAMDGQDFDTLLGDIELKDGYPGGRSARTTDEKEIIMKNSKTGKRSAALVILLAAAFLVAATAGALGIGYLINHKDTIDSYFGSGAGDKIEQDGLLESDVIATLDHLRVIKEAGLSTDCISTLIVTVEATDEIGRSYIAGQCENAPSLVFGTVDPDGGSEAVAVTSRQDGDYDTEVSDFDKPSIAFIETGITKAFGDKLEGWTIRPKYYDGYMTFMFIFEHQKPDVPVTVPLELYMIKDGCSGDGIFDGSDLDEGNYLCTVEFSTQPNIGAKELVGEDSGKVIRLYDYVLISDQYVPLGNESAMFVEDECPFDVVFEYADGSTYKITDNDIALMHHFVTGEQTEDEEPDIVESADGQTFAANGADTRLVLSRFINIQEVESVVIDGERFTVK